MTPIDASDLRAQMRARRRALDAGERERLASLACAALARHPLYRDARTLAAYLAVDGELSPSPLIERAAGEGKAVYLPRLEGQAMHFHCWRPGDELAPNRFGIPEPLPETSALGARELDLVLLPLVAFDGKGNRLGMGGGYYDRTFAPKQRAPGTQLIGFAYAFQRVGKLEPNTWDVPLDGVASEDGIELFARDKRAG